MHSTGVILLFCFLIFYIESTNLDLKMSCFASCLLCMLLFT